MNMRLWIVAVTFLTLACASALNAVPLRMEYTVSGSGPYTYNFKLILDNNDNTWVAPPVGNQGWRWLIFGDQNSAPSPLVNWVTTSSFPVGPWTSIGSSGGGHNGPSFNNVLDFWVPTTLNETLQWAGTSTADLAQGQMLWSTIAGTQGGAVAADFVVATRISAVLNVTAAPGTQQLVAANEQGPGSNGFVAGTFLVSNTSSTNPGILTGIQIQGGGTGNHAAAYAPFTLYRESGITAGYDVADVAIGTGSFTGSPLRVTFPLAGTEQSYGPAQIKQYYLVARLNGTPQPAQTFTFTVNDLLLGAASSKSGVPSAVMNGFSIDGPILTVTPIAAAAIIAIASETGPGANGFVAASFTIAGNAQGATSLNSITVLSSGTGNDQQAFTQVALYIDSDANGSFLFGTDTLYGSAAVSFPANNGSLLFSQAVAFAASQSRRFFVVVKLGGSPPPLNLQTFSFSISAITVGSGQGSFGTPTAVMSGITITGPQLALAITTGITQSVLTTETGPGSNGRLAAMFTITNNNVASGALASVVLQASGTGNDLTAFTQVALYEDTNNNQTFEFGTDTAYGTPLAAFTADNGTATFSASLVFAVSQSRRMLVVCKLGGSPATHGLTFNFLVTSITGAPGVNTSGTPTTVMNGFTILGPVLTVDAVPGVAQGVFANATGTGNVGIRAGTFTVTNSNSTLGTLTSITLTASGTGNDLSAYTSVQLFEDSNTNSTWDVGTDPQVGGTLTAFSGDNGQASFAPVGGHAFIALQMRRYFIVVKLNGALLPAVNDSFNYAVSAMVVSTNSLPGPLPSVQMNGLVVIAPAFVIADNPLPVVTVYRGSTDVLLQKFVVTYPAGPNNAISSLSLKATGSGNDSLNLSGLRLYLDANANGTFEPATDTLAATSAAGFTSDNGLASFSVVTAAAPFVPLQSKTFFYVANFGVTALNNTTFTTRVEGGVPGYPGTTFTGAPAPAGYTAGAVMLIPDFVFTDNSAATISNAFLGDPGFTLQKFTVGYPVGPNNGLGSITLTASGTGNDLNAYAAVHLYLDDPVIGTPGAYDATDTLVNTQPAFNADNGQLSFNLSGPAALFFATEVKQFIVVVDFNQNGSNATTFASSVTAMAGANLGAQPVGLPAGPSAGLNLLDANLRAAFNGPGLALTVNSDSQGINNEGHLLCDVTLETGPGSDWSINTLVFVGTGTANQATAYINLWLYEDDGSGAWDGPLVDTPAGAPVASFAAGTSEASFALLNSDTAVNSLRRFFLRGRLAGTATTGQTLNARLENVIGTPDIGGSVRGTPLPASTALIIESTALTVQGGPATPNDLLRKTGTPLFHSILNVRMGASNNDVDVSAITFSNAGTGDFASSLSANGFQLFLDDGDGVFTAGDTLLFQGAGGPLVAATFSSPVTVPNSGTRDLWVVLDFLATAGDGAALPRSYQSVIDNPGHVTASAGAAVLMGTPAPQSNVVRIVDFFVTSFDPVADLPSGGRDITITGSGFLSPIIVLIDGNVCPGAAVINSGTQVTGIQVPPGTGLDVAITVKSGSLDAETLTQTFDYVPLQPPKVNTASGCVAGAGVSAWWLAVAAFTPLAVRLRRRK